MGKMKFLEKLDMYDMIVANLIAGNSVVEPSKALKSTEIAIGFSNISSESQISKYYMVRQLPDFLNPKFLDLIRSSCTKRGVIVNFYTYGEPYVIDWDSNDMKNKMRVWEQYTVENKDNQSEVFSYRNLRGEKLAKKRIVTSVKYLNQAELDYGRNLSKVTIVIELTCKRDKESMMNMSESMQEFKKICGTLDIKVAELRVNLIDWMKAFGMFSLNGDKEINGRISKKVLSDDLIAKITSYKQGRVGSRGVPIAMDVKSGSAIMHKFRQNPESAENWIISAATGGGKSMLVKYMMTWLMTDNFVVTVMDYEGDEYSNFATYVKEGNPEDVKIISAGKGSTLYLEPMEIPDLTGDPEVDDGLKEQAINYTMAYFRLMVAGTTGVLDRWEEKVISTAIDRVYDLRLVTSNKETWKKSKGLTIKDVYDEIKRIVRIKELVDFDNDNLQHKAAIRVQESCSVYFEEGAIKSGAFKNPMSLEELYKARFIVFSFGMKGEGDNQTDQTMLALKQLSVANITIQISNYCKYVRKCFNAKVWEEFQRWGEAQGSSEIILNAITGGRKRGDVNFILTNNLAALLDESKPLNKGLRGNIQNYAIGKIPDKGVREQFCKTFELENCMDALSEIANAKEASGSLDSGGEVNKYVKSFCFIFEDGKRAIGKVRLPKSILKSKIFRSGIK